MRTDRPPLTLIVLIVVAGLAACLIAAAAMVPTMLAPLSAWAALIAGFVALIASLAGVWFMQKARDRTLR